MTTATPRAALKRIFAGLANLPLPYVSWKGEPEDAAMQAITPTFAVTGATNTAPITIATPSTTGLYDGMRVVLAGILGNVAANGSYGIDTVTPTGFNLTGSVGSAPYTSGGTVSLENPFRWGLLRIGAAKRSAVGWDDLIQTDNGDGSITMKSNGRRQILLSIDYLSFDTTALVMADDVLEDVRTKMWHPEILDAFNKVSCVVMDAGDVLDLPTTKNGRIISAAHLDITIAMAVTDTARFPFNEGTTVREVKGTGTITKEDGTTTTTVNVDVVGS